MPWAALRLGRPVKWIEDRRENFFATTQERGQIHDAEMALSGRRPHPGRQRRVPARHRRLRSLRAHRADQQPVHAARLLRRAGLRQRRSRAVFTNKPIVTPVRGAGRQHGVFVMERLLDLAARELGIDRGRDPPPQLPRARRVPARPRASSSRTSGRSSTTAATTPPALDEAVELHRLRAASCATSSRGCGPRAGTSASASSPTSRAPASAPTRARGSRSSRAARCAWPPASARRARAISPAFAQIVADQLGVDVAAVQVDDRRHARVPLGHRHLRQPRRRRGRQRLSRGRAWRCARRSSRWRPACSARRSEPRAGRRHGARRRQPTRAIALGELAARANPLRGAVTPGTEPGLEATAYFGPERGSTASGVHAMIVEVDPRDGDGARSSATSWCTTAAC